MFTYISFISLLLHGTAVTAYVAEIQHKVGADKQRVENVQIGYNVGVVCHFVDYAEDVTQDNKSHKDRAFTYHYLCAQRFGNRNGPAHRKTKQEKDFPNAE